MENELKRRKLILQNFQSPGDLMMLTATVRDLHKAYPGQFLTDVRTSCDALWENNPYISKIDDKDPEAEVIKCEYPLIHRSNSAPYHFIHGFTEHLETYLDMRIPMTYFGGDIHLSDDEKKWASQVEELGIKDDYWILVSGGKYDFNAKWLHPDYMQEVVDHFRGKITFVQTGEKNHWHPKIRGTINLIDKTDLRQFIRLVYHSTGVLSGVTLGMHAAAGVPMKKGKPKNRAAVIVAGAREPFQWEAYPHHRYLGNNGALSCSDSGGCWLSRCTKIKDSDDKNKDENLCLFPVPIFPKAEYPEDKIDGDLRIAKCIMMITPEDIIRAIESYYEGDMYTYKSSLPDFLPPSAREHYTP